MCHPKQPKLSCFNPAATAATAHHQHHSAHTCATLLRVCVCEEESRQQQTAVLSTLGSSAAADRLTVWSGRSERCLHSAVSGHLSAVWLPCCWLKECLLVWWGKKGGVFFFFYFKARERVMRKISPLSAAVEAFSTQVFISSLSGFWSKLSGSATWRLTDALKNPSKRKQAAFFELWYLFKKKKKKNINRFFFSFASKSFY